VRQRLMPAARNTGRSGTQGMIRNTAECFRDHHPGNVNGVIRDRYKCRRPLRFRIGRKRRSRMTGAGERLNRLRCELSHFGMKAAKINAFVASSYVNLRISNCLTVQIIVLWRA
jgi:hypothetical protein